MKGDGRGAQAALKKLAQEFRNHPETPWWTVAAKLNMLGAAPTADRTAVMQELDALAQAGPPPRDAAVQLAPVLRALGENERAERLA
jgi:thioredoxin-like negative regulator of GroEL